MYDTVWLYDQRWQKVGEQNNNYPAQVFAIFRLDAHA